MTLRIWDLRSDAILGKIILEKTGLTAILGGVLYSLFAYQRYIKYMT